MSDLLTRMAHGSERRAAEARQRESEADLRRRALESPPATAPALDGPGFDVFAEIKRRAPSAGRLAGREVKDVARRAEVYAAAGAALISVLTEPDEFAGSLDDLREAAASVRVPVMRKDFLVDPYQMFEARAAGAAGALLIVRMLDDSRMTEMLHAAGEADLFVLVEAFDENDLDRAQELATRAAVRALVGLNARDLSSLRVDRERFRRLRSRFPAGRPRIAESGLDTIDDVRGVASLGYRAALIGSALMRADDPGRLLREMIREGRKEASRCACE